MGSSAEAGAPDRHEPELREEPADVLARLSHAETIQIEDADLIALQPDLRGAERPVRGPCRVGRLGRRSLLDQAQQGPGGVSHLRAGHPDPGRARPGPRRSRRRERPAVQTARGAVQLGQCGPDPRAALPSAPPIAGPPSCTAWLTRSSRLRSCGTSPCTDDVVLWDVRERPSEHCRLPDPSNPARSSASSARCAPAPWPSRCTFATTTRGHDGSASSSYVSVQITVHR